MQTTFIGIENRESRVMRKYHARFVGGHTEKESSDHLAGCLPTFISTVIHAKERFGRELALLKTYPHAWIVVEGALDDVLQGRYDARVHPQALLAITASLMTQYHIPVLFAGDRPSARALVEELLVQWHAHQPRKGEAHERSSRTSF